MTPSELRAHIGGYWDERAGGFWRCLDAGEVRGAARAMLAAGARFSALVAVPLEGGAFRLWWSFDHGGALLSVETALARGEAAPSVVDIYPGADWAEREARDYFALSFDGRAASPPLVLREGDAPGVLLRGEGGRP
jgi:hypothetical protein